MLIFPIKYQLIDLRKFDANKMNNKQNQKSIPENRNPNYTQINYIRHSHK